MGESLKIFTDGGARGNPGPAAIGVYVTNGSGEVVFQLARAIGRTTNNEAEYEAVLASLEWLKQALISRPIERVAWYLDSLLVVEQLNKRWKIKEPRLQLLAQRVWRELQGLGITNSFTHVTRDKNVRADRLVNQALDAVGV